MRVPCAWYIIHYLYTKNDEKSIIVNSDISITVESTLYYSRIATRKRKERSEFNYQLPTSIRRLTVFLKILNQTTRNILISSTIFEEKPQSWVSSPSAWSALRYISPLETLQSSVKFEPDQCIPQHEYGANETCLIAPKKKEQQKMSLGAFMTDESKQKDLASSPSSSSSSSSSLVFVLLIICRTRILGRRDGGYASL